MNLQIIKSVDGRPEYVLLPLVIYNRLRKEIEKQLSLTDSLEDYELFKPEDYIENPIALARIKAHLTQEELAKLMDVSQAYISKIEKQVKVSPKVLEKVKMALNKLKK